MCSSDLMTNLFPWTDVHNLNIDWVLKVLKQMAEEWKELIKQVEGNSADIEEPQKQVADLEKLLEDIKNGDYVDLYLDALQNWIDQNLQNLVANIVKYIWFGLTDDGHFCAHIPKSWDFITFDTNMNYDSDRYGRLLLYY